MSHEAVHWVLDNSTAAGTDKVLLLSIAYHTSREGARAWPSIATLARHSGVGERAVQKALRRLEEGGHLVIEEKAGGQRDGRYRTNAYLLPGFRGELQDRPEVSPSSPLDDPEVNSRTIQRCPPGPSEVSPRTPEQKENSKEKTLTLVSVVADEPECGFESFWKLYPRSDARKAALKAWLHLSRAERHDAREAVANYAATLKRNKTEKRYIPHGATWLNGHRWLDIPEASAGGGSNGRVYDADTGAWLSAHAVGRMS